MDRPGFEADRFHIVMRNWETGENRRIDFEYEGIDTSPHGLKFSTNGKTMYATASYLGQRSLFKMDVKSGKVSMVEKMGRHSGVNLLDGRILYGMQSLQGPTELYTIKPNGKDRKQITDLNGEKLAKCLMGEPEQFTFKGWNDETVYAYVVKPYDWSEEKAAAGQKWPVTFLIHGGPQGSFGNDFHYRWNPQTYAGAGYARWSWSTSTAPPATARTSPTPSAATGAIGPSKTSRRDSPPPSNKCSWMDSERVGRAGRHPTAAT
jgi:dipeptidyl aminopeptidase/acylaminoacyl peptidase